MKKILLLILVGLTVASAEINEYLSDVYFANGIDTTYKQAKAARDDLNISTMITYPQSYRSIKKWGVSYNHTQGIGIDLYESMLQKIDEDWRIKYALDFSGILNFTYGGIAKMVTKKVAKEAIEEFAAKQAQKIARKIFLKYAPGSGIFEGYTQAAVELIFHKVFEKIIDDLIMQVVNIPEEDIKRREQKDVKTQFSAYTQSIKDGHGVVVIAHSQGNLFTNVAYDMFTNHWLPWNEDTEWMRRYFSAFAVASPANDVLGQSEPHITFDNDIIGIVPNSLKWNIKNPIRYYYENAVGEKIDNRFSFEAHAFLTSYMKEKVTRDHILGFIRNRVDEQTYNKMLRPSQWKPKNLGCICKDKYAKMTHKFDPEGMNQYLSYEKVKDFEEGAEGKIYKADAGDHAEYVRALDGDRSGDGVFTIEEVDSDDTCYVLKDDASSQIGEIKGLKEYPKAKDGVVELSLGWDKPELDYDLVVDWDAGEVDIKDTGCPMEHFHIQSQMEIYPGTYRVNIIPKDPSDEGWKDPLLYPFEVVLVTRTPGASDTMLFKVKNQSDINLGHVSDIKVFRSDDNNSDDNTTDPDPDPDPDNGNGDGGGNGGSGGFIIAPEPAPDCPPVDHTPSPTPPKPIYFPSGGSGGWIYGACCGGGTSYGSGGGGGSGGGSGHTPTYTAQDSPDCTGDRDCLPDVSDASNSSSNPEESDTPSIPLPPEVGGRPLPDEDEEDNCTGNSSCGCIPCEYEIIPYLKQIYFGPLRDANFSIYSLDGYEAGVSLFDGTTSKGKTLYDAGEIDVPQVFLNTLEDDKLYIIEAKGGEDIDRNDDFIVDTNATKNQGKVYAIASGKDIKYTGFKINILTTVTFELLKESIANGDTQEEIESKISQIASRLLRYRVYPSQADTNITNVDLLAWLPTIDKDLLLRSYDPLKEMVTKIYNAENIYDEAYAYVFSHPVEDNATKTDLPFEEVVQDESKPPIIRSFVKSIPEDAVGGTPVGKIEILRGSEDIYFGKLVGKGSETFEVTSDGEIRLRQDATLDYETKWFYDLKIEAFNKNGGSGFVAVYISVKNVLDAPEYVGYEGMIVDENISAGTKVGQLFFTQGASAITSMELRGESTDMFTIDNNGTIRLAQGKSLDYEKTYSYGFWAMAYNSYGSSMPVILHINIKDVADSPRILEYKGGYVHENATEGALVGEVIYDKGGADIDTIVLDGNGSENFTIDLNGTIRVSNVAALDYEQYTSYGLTVTISNAYGSTTRKIPISVVNTNDVPSFVSFTGGNVKENSPVGTVVGQIRFDAGSMPIDTISLTGEGSEKFRILENGTIIVAQNMLNYEEKNHYKLTVIAHSAVGDSLPLTVHLIVDDISERPAVLQDFVVNNVEENLSIGTIIGKITILDEGSSPIELFEVSGDGSDKFSVDAEGKVSIATVLDFDTQEIYNLHVKAKNGAGFGNEVSLIVRLSDVADIVPQLQGLTIKIDENITAGTVVGEANVLETGDTPITGYLLKGADNEKFDVNTSGAITVAQNDAFDYEMQTHYYLTLMALNEAGESSPVGVAVNIMNSPDVVPVIKEGILRVNENSPKDTIIGQIQIVTTGDSAIDSYEINGERKENFYVDENATLRVSANATLDYENIKSYTLQVRAHNAAGYSNEVTYVIWIDNVPDLLPVLSYRAMNLVEENQTKSMIVGQVSVTQSDTPITSMTISGSGSETFTIDANGTLSCIENPGFDYENISNYVLYVTAQNSAGNSEPLKINIPIGNVEENPKLAPFSATIDENATAGTIVGKVQIIHSGDSPIVSMTLTGTGSSDFTIDTNGTMRVSQSAKLDYETRSSYALKVVATNKNGHSSNYGYYEYANINLNNIPDEPIIAESGTYEVDENASVGTVIGQIDIVSIGDSPIDHFKNVYGGLEIDTNGTIRVGASAALDYETSNQLTIYPSAVNQNGNKSNYLTITVRIKNIPDEPILKSNQIFNVDENATVGTIVGNIEVLDEGDTPIDTYEITSDYYGIYAIDANGTISVKDTTNLDYEHTHQEYLYVKAKNESGKYSNTVSIRININNVPDEPVVPEATFTIEENATAGTVVGELNITSTGDSPIATIMFDEYNDYNEYFTIDNNGTIRVSENANLDYENHRNYEFGIEVANENGNTIYTYVTINLSNIPDEPILGTYVNCNVNEHSEVGTKVCQVNIVDEGDSPIVSIDFVDYNGLHVDTPFQIDTNGTVTVKDSIGLDYEKQVEYYLKVMATNESGKKSKIYNDYDDNVGDVYIYLINDPYDAPMLRRKTIYVDENTSIGTTIDNVLTNEGKAAINATAVYEVAYSTYNMTSNKVSNLFELDLAGNIIVKNVLDYDTQFKPCQNNSSTKRYCEYVNIQMTNQYGSTTLYRQEIEIGNLPDTPPTVQGMTFNIDENATIGTKIGKINIVNQGEANITGFDINGSNYFSIDENGTIILKQQLDYETKTSHLFNVTAQNIYGTSNTAKVIVHVNNVIDETPVLSNLTANVDENALPGTVVGTLDIVSLGDSAISAIALSGNGNENFAVDTNGSIKIAQDVLDFESQSTYEFNATATNQAGESEPVSVSIMLNDIHKIVLNDFDGVVEENSPSGTVIGKIEMDTSEDTPQTITLSGTGSELFTVDADGTIKVADGATIDYEKRSSYMLKAIAQNSFVQSNEINIIISIVDVSESSPTIDFFYESTNENSPEGTVIGALIIKSETPITNIALTGTGHENFIVDMNGTISVASGANLDYEQQNYYYLTVAATNAYGTSAGRSMTIYLQNLPDTPPEVNVWGTLIVEDGQDSSRTVGGVNSVYVWSDSSVDSVRLEGDGADDFVIDTAGHISIAPGVTIDINTTKQYMLSLIASNTFGESEPQEINIKVHNSDYLTFDQHDQSINVDNIVTDSEGNFYLGGTIEKYGSRFAYGVPVIVKYDADKNLLWTKEYGVTLDSSVFDGGAHSVKIGIDKNDLLYISGNVNGSLDDADEIQQNQETGAMDVFAISLENNGTTRWIKQFGTPDDEYVNMLLNDNKVYIGSNIDSEYDIDENISTDSSGVIYVLDQNGTLDHVKQSEKSSVSVLRSFDRLKSDAGFLVGTVRDSGFDLVKLDDNLQFDSLYGLDILETDTLLTLEDKEGNIYIVQKTYQSEGVSSLMISKYNPEGVLLWSQEYEGDVYIDQAYADANRITLIGTEGNIGRILEFDTQGTLLADKSYGLGEEQTQVFMIDGKVYLVEGISGGAGLEQ